MSRIAASRPRRLGAHVFIALLLATTQGCYLSHGTRAPVSRDGGADAARPDAGRADAGRPDAGVDAAPPGIPDGSVAVTRPCDRDHPSPLPGGRVWPACDITTAGDHDSDGFDNAIDCDDCNPQVNPGAYDFPGNGVDEDCSGSDGLRCDDSGLALDSSSALDAARAIGLCAQATRRGREWGVLSARFTTGDGLGEPASPMQVGLLPHFGVNEPYDGDTMLVLSTSFAREPDPGASFCRDHGLASGYPPGFPVDAPACPDVVSGPPFDPVALEVRIRVPTNVTGLQFASAMFTHEYPDFICSPFNDVFAVLQERETGFENIVFDASGNPMTVNNALLSACARGRHGGRDFACPLGTAILRGTGYDVGCAFIGRPSRADSGASSGCVQTLSRVEPGRVTTLRFAIWDSGDGQLDSTAVVDGFDWMPQDFERVAP